MQLVEVLALRGSFFSLWPISFGLFACLDFGSGLLFLFLSLAWVLSFFKGWQGFHHFNYIWKVASLHSLNLSNKKGIDYIYSFPSLTNTSVIIISNILFIGRWRMFSSFDLDHENYPLNYVRLRTTSFSIYFFLLFPPFFFGIKFCRFTTK